MNILQINKYVTLNGGSESVMSNLTMLFQGKGDQVTNIGFSIDNQELVGNSIVLGRAKHSVARFFVDSKIVDTIVDVVAEKKIDLVVLHNVYHDFPHAQLIHALKKKTNVVILGILHDSKPVCPTHIMLRDGKICEECRNGAFFSCVTHNCMNNFMYSALVALDSWWNISLRDVYQGYDILISPSIFLKSKLFEMGFRKNVSVLHNPIFLPDIQSVTSYASRRKQILYAGRISREKGVDKLIEIARSFPECDFILAGDGPELESIKNIARNCTNIVCKGYLRREQLVHVMQESLYLCIPSICNENNPMIVLEAQSYGLPIIGSNKGGIPELVSDGRGFVFDPDDLEGFGNIVTQALALDECEYEAMSKKCRDFAESNGIDKYYENILGLIEEVRR